VEREGGRRSKKKLSSGNFEIDPELKSAVKSEQKQKKLKTAKARVSVYTEQKLTDQFVLADMHWFKQSLR